MVKYITAYKILALGLTLGFLILLGSTTLPKLTIAQAPGIPADIDLEQCAEDLTEYMNEVLEIVDGNVSDNVKLTSIAFNLTSPFEWPLFQLMVEYGANFEDLDYWAGNSYTVSGVKAYDWYSPPAGSPPGGANWKAAFQQINPVGMMFTEYGDFETNGTNNYYSSSAIESMKVEFERAITAGDKVIYFSPFPGNTQFDFHNINLDHLRYITSLSPSNGGANSAQQLATDGSFATKVNEVPLGYVLEIITGPDVNGVVNYINGLPPGMIPVIRSCWGDSCGMKDPGLLGQFILDVDAQVNRRWHVLVGPNEPLTDPWVSPACGTVDDREWYWQWAPCGGTKYAPDRTDPEFHSLRPYPASEAHCLDPNRQGSISMCGTSIIAEQLFKFEPDPDLILNNEEYCVESIETQIVTYETEDGPQQSEIKLSTWDCQDIPLQSSVYATVNFDGAELPVLGNTEDVPNGESAASQLSYEQRVNNYISWYLQGVIPTAEEDFASHTSPTGLEKIINFSGPINKLISRDIMTGFVQQQPDEDIYLLGSEIRTSPTYFQGLKVGNSYIAEGDHTYEKLHIWITKLQAGPVGVELVKSVFYEPENRYGFYLTDNPAQGRHDQIVVCSNGFPEACYVSKSQLRERKSQIEQQVDDSQGLKYPYIPLTTTEDVTVTYEVQDTSYGQPGGDDSTGFEEEKYLENDFADPDPIGIKNFDRLFYAHLREVSQLSRLLQSTYVPDGFPSDSTSGMPPLEDPEILPFCTIVGAYSNPGDDLYGNLEYKDFCPNATLSGIPNASECADDERTQIPGVDIQPIRTRLDYSATVECQFKESFNHPGFDNCVATVDRCMATVEDCEAIDTLEQKGIVNYADESSENPFCPDILFTGEINPTPVHCKIVAKPAKYESCIEGNINEPEDCKPAVKTSFNTSTETPYIEEIFNRLVYGNMSAFRRIFPRLAENNKLTFDEELASIVVPGPEGKIKHVPGETTVSFETGYEVTEYNADSLGEYGGGNTYAGNPSRIAAGTDAKIYFPYLGTLHQHFLRDIQCSLLPASIGCNNTSLKNDGNVCLINHPVIQSQELLNLIAKAADWANVPVDVLVTAVRVEGCGGGERVGGICQYTDDQVLQYSAPGAKDPRNCPGTPGDGRAKGPMQFYDNPVNWGTWADAIKTAGVRDSGYSPNICNIADAIYAGAYSLSAGFDGCPNPGHDVSSAPAQSSWTLYQKQDTLTAWSSGCLKERCAPSPLFGWYYCEKLDEWGAEIETNECTAATPTPTP